MPRTRRRGALLVPPLLTLLLAVAACGGSDPADTVAGGQGGGSAAGPQADPMADYARCMRDNGIQMPDPVEDDPASLYEGVDMASAAFVAADKECAGLLSGVVQDRQEQDPQTEQEQADELLDLARCLREHGIDVADPVPGKPGGAFGGTLDRGDPAVAAALDDCSTSTPVTG